MASRLIDPVRHIERAADAQSGVLTPREVATRQDQASRINAEPDRNQRYLIFETIDVHVYDVPANAFTQMGHFFASSATTFTVTNASPDISTQCRICGLRIMSNGSGVTAGTVVPTVRVTEGSDVTDYVFDELTLSVTEPRRKAVIVPWEQAIQLSQDATFFVGLTTDVGYLPTTIDYKCHITIGYDQWI